jgi:hypothetical protein
MQRYSSNWHSKFLKVDETEKAKYESILKRLKLSSDSEFRSCIGMAFQVIMEAAWNLNVNVVILIASSMALTT